MAQKLDSLPQMEITAHTRNIRDILEVLIAYAKPLTKHIKGMIAECEHDNGKRALEGVMEITRKMEIAEPMWMAVAFHEDSIITLGNEIFESFSNLLRIADQLGVELDVPQTIMSHISNMPRPVSELRMHHSLDASSTPA